MADAKKKEAALMSSFVSVYEKNSFICIGYIYSEKFQRVFAYGHCINDSDQYHPTSFRRNFSVKSTSGSSRVKDIKRVPNFLVIFVSICI